MPILSGELRLIVNGMSGHRSMPRLIMSKIGPFLESSEQSVNEDPVTAYNEGYKALANEMETQAMLPYAFCTLIFLPFVNIIGCNSSF